MSGASTTSTLLSTAVSRCARTRCTSHVGRPQAVFDATYKIERDNRGVPNADNYQGLAYCTALRLRCAYSERNG